MNYISITVPSRFLHLNVSQTFTLRDRSGIPARPQAGFGQSPPVLLNRFLILLGVNVVLKLLMLLSAQVGAAPGVPPNPTYIASVPVCRSFSEGRSDCPSDWRQRAGPVAPTYRGRYRPLQSRFADDKCQHLRPSAGGRSLWRRTQI